MKLLLVDDDVFLRDMYSLKFSEANFSVSVAEDGSSALRQLEMKHDFDVVLLDMIMPGMSGTQLIKAIKTRFPDMGAKCIVLSNEGKDEEVAEAKQAGADGYIIKAETIPSEVVERVKEILGK